MKRANYLFALAMALCALGLGLSTGAKAQTNANDIKTIDVRNLTPEQRVALLNEVAKLEKGGSPTNISATVRQEAEKWGELGANAGRAMVGAAKEVGVAANEFANTTLGKVTLAIIVYKIVGRDALRTVFGALLITVGTIGSALLWRSPRWSDHKIEYKPVLWGLYNKAYITEFKESGDASGARVMVSMVLLVAAWLFGGMAVVG